MQFDQSPWLKPYIELNTNLRRQATCKFDEDQAKLMNNSYFGKTCEDVRKYTEAKMYSILPLEGGKKATAKGINANVKNNILTHQDYKTSLFKVTTFLFITTAARFSLYIFHPSQFSFLESFSISSLFTHIFTSVYFCTSSQVLPK